MNRRYFLQSGAVLAISAVSSAQPSMPAGEQRPLPAPIQALKNRKSEAKPITLDRAPDAFRAGTRAYDRAEAERHPHDGRNIAQLLHRPAVGNSERMVCFVLPVKGDGFFVCPVFEEGRLHERLVSVPGGETSRIYTWQEDQSPYVLVQSGLADLGVLSGTLGIEERTPFVFANEIAHACPNLKLVEATPVTAGCRMIKSAAELALMRGRMRHHTPGV